jgi:hypothetical protein
VAAEHDAALEAEQEVLPDRLDRLEHAAVDDASNARRLSARVRALRLDAFPDERLEPARGALERIAFRHDKRCTRPRHRVAGTLEGPTTTGGDMNFRIPLALVGLVAGATVFELATPSRSLGDDRICRGSIGAATIDDNVRVPRGATCRLTRTYVKGNVLVSRNATLIATRVRVDGNVQAERARRVVVRTRSNVDGDVQADRGRAVSVLRSRIDGNIQLKANRGRIVVNRNTVNGDIQLFSNRARSEVRRNRVDGNLQCKSNRPAPVGGGNIVEGNKEDQCRRL